MKHLEVTQGLIGLPLHPCALVIGIWQRLISAVGCSVWLGLSPVYTCFELGLSVCLAGHSAFWMHLFVYILYPRKESGILVVAITSPLC